MNPELWKLKRDSRTQEHRPHYEHSITNDYPATMRMRASDAMPGDVEHGQDARGRMLLDDGIGSEVSFLVSESF